MSKFVDSVFNFLGRRSSKDQAATEITVTKRPRRGGGGRKNVLKADSFVFLPGQCTSNGTYLWGEVITPRTVGVPPSSYSDDYSVLPGGEQRKNIRSVLVDGNGKIVGRRLSGSFVAKAVKTRNSCDEVEDGSLEAFLKEFESEDETRCHTYDRAADTRAEIAPAQSPDDDRDVYDRLVHLPVETPASLTESRQKRLRIEESEKRRNTNNVLDLQEGGGRGPRRRASSGGSTEHYYTVPADQRGHSERREGAVDWVGLRDMLELAAIRGKETERLLRSVIECRAQFE